MIRDSPHHTRSGLWETEEIPDHRPDDQTNFAIMARPKQASPIQGVVSTVNTPPPNRSAPTADPSSHNRGEPRHGQAQLASEEDARQAPGSPPSGGIDHHQRFTRAQLASASRRPPVRRRQHQRFREEVGRCRMTDSAPSSSVRRSAARPWKPQASVPTATNPSG